MDNLDVLRDIRGGKKLSEYPEEEITPLMVLAALDSRDAWDEVPEKLKNRRFAKMAVAKNFRNILKVPEENVMHCSKAYATWGRNLTRKDLDDYMDILNTRPAAFAKNVVKVDPALMRFVKKTKDTQQEKQRLNRVKVTATTNMKKKPKTEHFYVDQEEFSAYDFANDEDLGHIDELNPEAYLARPVKLQTLEDLEALLKIDDKFPSDFIARLQMPYKNAAFYEKHNQPDKAAEWKTRQIPWLNRQIIDKIAMLHPEASIATPAYLKPEYISNFWAWAKKNNYTKRQLTEYFLMFPASMLTQDMIDDIEIDWQVLRHVPDLLIGSEEARLYLNRYPNDVFRLQEGYQTLTKVIADGTMLNAANISLIKNPELRTCIAVAMGLENLIPNEEA